MALIALLAVAGCDSPLSLPANGGEAGVIITINGDEGRTLFPKDTFIRYDLTLTGPEGQTRNDSITSGKSKLIEGLTIGEWEITVKGYVRISGIEYEAASGSDTVNITQAGQTQSKSITISAQMTGTGYVTYSVTYPANREVNYAEIYFKNLSTSVEYRATLTNANLPSNTDGFAAGYYLGIIKLYNTNNEILATKTEIIHVYANMETEARITFTADDFSNRIILSGAVSYTIEGVPYPIPDNLYIEIYRSNAPYDYFIDRAYVDNNGQWSVSIPAFQNNTNLRFEAWYPDYYYDDYNYYYGSVQFGTVTRNNVRNANVTGINIIKAETVKLTIKLEEAWQGVPDASQYHGFTGSDDSRRNFADFLPNNHQIQVGNVYRVHYTFISDKLLPSIMFVLVYYDANVAWEEFSGYMGIEGWSNIEQNRVYNGYIDIIVKDPVNGTGSNPAYSKFNLATAPTFGENGPRVRGSATVKFSRFDVEVMNFPSISLSSGGGGYQIIKPLGEWDEYMQGMRILAGDEFSMTIEFFSNVAIPGGVELYLVDSNGTQLSNRVTLTTWGDRYEIYKNEFFSSSATLTATQTASSTAPAANRLAVVTKSPHPQQAPVLKIKEAWGYIDGVGTSIDNPPFNMSPTINLGNMTSSNSGWHTLLREIADAKRFVALDLSNCTMNGTVFNPDPSPSFIDPSLMNVPGKNRIVSIILPTAATSIPDYQGNEQDPGGWELMERTRAFRGFNSLRSVTGANITIIGKHAFKGGDVWWEQDPLTSVNFPKAVTIGERAFEQRSNLIFVDFPLVTTIGNFAFFRCTNLQTALFPAVTNIGNDAFSQCVSLQTADFSAVASIGAWAFAQTGNTTLFITMGANAPTLGTDIFTSWNEPKNVTIRVPSGATGYGTSPTDEYDDNWGNGFRGGGWNGTNMLGGYVHTAINLTIVEY